MSKLDDEAPLRALGPWQTGKRWWHGNAPEWDLVSRSEDERRLLVAELKWSAKPFERNTLEALARGLLAKPLPSWHARDAKLPVTRALFVPSVAKGVPRELVGVQIVRGSDLFAR